MQYAIIPIESLEIKNKKVPRISYQISKENPYKTLKLRDIVVKIDNEMTPYIEELLTNNKIGLNKKDEYSVYLPGEVIYSLVTEEEAYLRANEEINYQSNVNTLWADKM